VLSLRDAVDIQWSEAQLTLVKAIVVGPGSTTADPVQVQANDTVTYAVDVNNSGDLTATSTEVWTSYRWPSRARTSLRCRSATAAPAPRAL